jgi:hypothetical protein
MSVSNTMGLVLSVVLDGIYQMNLDFLEVYWWLPVNSRSVKVSYLAS